MSGEVPKGWHYRPLGEIATVSTGGTPRREVSEYWGGEIPWMTSGEVNLRYVRDVEGRITERGLAESNARWLPAGTIMMAMAGQGSTRGKVALLEAPVTCNQSIAGITPTDAADSRFLFHQLESLYREFRMINGDDVRGGLNLALIRDARVVLPPLPEQKKIAAILSSVDEAIQATQAVIDQTRRVKEGLLQDLLTRGLPGHTRFKQTEIGEIPWGWDLLPADSVCESVIDCKNRTPPETESGFAVVRTPNVRDGRFVLAGLKFTDPASYEVWTQRGKPRPGDVLITREAPVGEVALLPASIGPSCLGQRMMMYRTGKRLNNEFMLAALLSPQVQKHLLKLAGGSTVGHVRVDDIRTLPIPVPPLEEQVRIARIVGEVAISGEYAEGEMLALLALKSALLQDLLTGRVRVSP